MKILTASVSVPGHLNPLLAAGSILGQRHEVAVQVSKEMRPAVEKAGLRYLPEIPGVSTSGGDFSAKHAEFLARTRGPSASLS
jgi:UDP:flavonoid glycosyltransferase YjiC (YdhE family)